MLEFRKLARKSIAIFLTQLKMQSEQATDVTLVLKDDKEIRVNGNELSAASDFFFTLQNTDMEERREGIIRLEHISENVMRDVLEFCRSGTVHITNVQHAQDLFKAADYFLIPGLKEAAEGFLRQTLQPSNCISIYYFAERYPCGEVAQLAVTAREYIFANFADVAESQEFLQLESQEVEKWICCDEIVVSSEEVVFRIILNWTNQANSQRRRNFFELFRHVRLSFISRGFLKKHVVTNRFVKESSCCLKRVKDALKGIFLLSDDPQQSPRTWSDSHLVIFIGTESLCYDTVKDKWYRLPVSLMHLSQYPRGIPFETIFLRGEDYRFPCLGQYDRGYSYNYHPSSGRWQTRSIGPRMHAVAAGLAQRIYFIDVRSKSIQYKSFSNPRTWTVVSSGEETPFIDDGVIAVPMGVFLYVLGTGLNKRQARRYDTKWERIADMNEEKHNGCDVAAHGKIFVVSGAVVSFEMYDVSSNQWQNVALSLHTRPARLRVASMVCLNDLLCMVTVNSTFPFASTVEIYDIKNNKWKGKSKIPVSLLHVNYRRNSIWLFWLMKGFSSNISKEMLPKPIHPIRNHGWALLASLWYELELCFNWVGDLNDMILY